MNAGWHTIAAATALSLLTPLASSGQDTPPSGGTPDTPVLLRLTPPEGQVSSYAASVQTEVDSPMTPSSGPLMTIRMQHTQTVLGVEDNVIRYRTTMDSMTTTSAMSGITGMLPNFTGSTMTVETDTRGRQLGVTSTQGMPDVGVSLDGIMQQSTSHFVLPEHEVSPGDSWTQGAPMNLPMGPTGGSMSMEVETTYTFVSLEGGLATLSFEGPFNMDADMAGMGMTGSGTMAGTMVVDLAEGRFLSQSSRTSLDLNMAGMAMKSTVTTTMELIPDP
jgi:hypothetical protein